MKEYRKVSNPLTIIAIFAGLAEVAGTTVLALLPESLQRIFMWFVIVFPVLLVALFFFVLWFKPKHFYAPSDYKDEKHFFDLMQGTKEIRGLLDKTSEVIETTIEEKPEMAEALEPIILASEEAKMILERHFVGDEKHTMWVFLVNNPGSTAREIGTQMGMTAKKVLAMLNEMKQDGAVISKGSTMHRYYAVHGGAIE